MVNRPVAVSTTTMRIKPSPSTMENPYYHMPMKVMFSVVSVCLFRMGYLYRAPPFPLYRALVPPLLFRAPKPDMFKRVELGPNRTAHTPTCSNLLTMKHGLPFSGQLASG